MLIFPREVESTQHHSSPVLSTRCLKNICQVGPSPVYTPLSVSVVSMHATFMTFIIHTYLHHLCILAFFNVFFEITCSGYIYPKKKRKKKEKKEKKGKEKRNRYGRVISPVGFHP